MKIYVSGCYKSAETMLEADDFYNDGNELTIKAGRKKRTFQSGYITFGLWYVDKSMIDEEIKDPESVKVDEQFITIWVDSKTGIDVFKAFREKNLLKER